MTFTRCFRKLLPLLCVIGLVDAAARGESAPPLDNFVVVIPVANMYRTPNRTSDVVSQAIYSTNVVLLKRKRKWMQVRTADRYTGWLESASLIKRKERKGKERTRQAKPYAEDGPVVRVAALNANIYRDPDVTAHAPILNLPWETRLEVASAAPSDVAQSEHRWLKILLADGQDAYVQSGDVSKDFAPLTIEQTLTLASRFLGVTYTWGGTSAYGYDCSGFTQMLIRQRGITMPRDADLQAAWSGVQPVDRKDLQPGDLLFFGSSPNDITHTGMYLGNGELIHDTTNEHPGVQVSNLNDEPWTKLLVAARRVK